MMTKILITLIISFIFSFDKLTAQEMSIEFSIEWKENLDFQFEEVKDHDIHPAFLYIKYRNISEKSLYSLKVIEGIFNLPIIAPMFKWPDFNKGKETFDRHNFSCFEYAVGFESDPFYYSANTWIIHDFNIYAILYGYYGYIFSFYYAPDDWENKVPQLEHNPANITQDTIMNESLEKFVFLKPGEKHEDRFNLIGFQLIGGTITFQLNDTKSKDYVKVNCDNMANEVATAKDSFDLCTNKPLPLKVGEYELFTGNFLTNQVRVHFPGISKKECEGEN